MPNLRACALNRKIHAILLAVMLIAAMLCFAGAPAKAKSNLSTEDSVKTVLFYFKNSAGEDVLLAQLSVSDMFAYLNDHLESIGQVHNYSILDRYVTPVHQEAQGFTVEEMLDYALSKSTLAEAADLDLHFSDSDSIAFWEVDDTAFDPADTYTYNSLYNVDRYNFPALYENWNYETMTYSNAGAIWDSRAAETVILSITAYSERYMISGQYGNSYNMENYFYNNDLLDTARTVRLMLPMTEDELWEQTPTASNSRYGICYILLDMETEPSFSLGKVAKPTYTLIDGDESDTDEYEADCWYFSLACETPGATIYYNDNSQSEYMPTAVYHAGQVIKRPKSATTPSKLKFRAVKEGYSDAGVQTASSKPEEAVEEIVDPNADVWDGESIDTAWYAGHESEAEYSLSTAAELAGLAALVNNAGGAGAVDFKNKKITLSNHIHLNGYTWEPIGTDMDRRNSRNGAALDTSYHYAFSGTFDGAGRTISGIRVNYTKATGSFCGLFGKVQDAALKNLTVSGSVSSFRGSALGGIAGYVVNSTFENCVNKTKVENSIGSWVGGIAGSVSTEGTTAFAHCVNYGTITGVGSLGGIAGDAAKASLTDCLNYGSVSGSANSVGGICGKNGNITRCLNYAAVSGNADVGGIAGAKGASSSAIDACLNTGLVTTRQGYAGGIVGDNEGVVRNCLNLGAVNRLEGTTDSNKNGIGGICGGFSGTMTACANYGAVSGKNYLGGLAGYLPKASSSGSNINNSYNHGSLVLNSEAPPTSYQGGIVGFVDTDPFYPQNKHTITQCYDLTGGAVFGGVPTNANLSKIYYLAGGVEVGNDPGTDRYGIDPRTDAQMKRSSFVTALGQYNANGNGTADGYFVYNAGGYPVLYWQQVPITFALTPAAATLAVKNSGGTMIAANPTGSYPLILGETYTYEASAAGYFSKSGSFTVTGTENIQVVLYQDKIMTDGPGRIILSWTGDPSTTQSAIWWDNSGEKEYVQYLAASGYTDESSFSSAQQVSAASKSVGYGEAAQTYYEATMTGLAAGATYYYRVGSDSNWSDISAFTTAPSATQNFSFMYMGDVQHETTAAAEYPVWGSLLSGAYAANPGLDFGLMGGDMVNSGIDMDDWTYFLSYASDVFSKIPLMTTNGNHESNFIGGKPQFYLDILALPQNGPAGFEEEFYSFDYGTVHVTVLNSWALSSEQNLDAAQKTVVSNWITNDLAAAQSAKFRIVVLHHPAYALQPDTVSAAVLSEWAPLLEAGKADLVFCGHQHVYARSYPVRAGQIDPENGVTYVMGNSGQKFYSTADTTYQEKTIFNKSTYQIVNVNGDTLSLSAYDSEGILVDAWSATAKSAVLAGDINGDGIVNVLDVVQAVNFTLGETTPTTEQFTAADVNKDGVINVLDVVQIVNKVLGS